VLVVALQQVLAVAHQRVIKPIDIVTLIRLCRAATAFLLKALLPGCPLWAARAGSAPGAGLVDSHDRIRRSGCAAPPQISPPPPVVCGH